MSTEQKLQEIAEYLKQGWTGPYAKADMAFLLNRVRELEARNKSLAEQLEKRKTGVNS